MLKHFIFDFGDVFINLDKQAPEKAFKNFGITEFSKEMLAKNHLYEKGLLSTEAFLGFYSEQFPNISTVAMRTAWNNIILDFPEHRLTFIEEFSKHNSCFLLSNINDLHLNYITEKLGDVFYKRFYKCFKKVYYSHEINLRKPDATIFEYVFDESQLNPQECFFVDDTSENTEIATKLGVHCWTINPREEDINDLPTKLIGL